MKSPSQYSDVAAVLDAALARGGGRYRLPTKGKAVQWRQRAYSLRKALALLDASRKPEGVPPITPYDQLILQIKDDDPCVVVISIRAPEGVLEDMEGGAVRPRQTTDLVNDPEQEAILDLVKKLGA